MCSDEEAVSKLERSRLFNEVEVDFLVRLYGVKVGENDFYMIRSS